MAIVAAAARRVLHTARGSGIVAGSGVLRRPNETICRQCSFSSFSGSNFHKTFSPSRCCDAPCHARCPLAAALHHPRRATGHLWLKYRGHSVVYELRGAATWFSSWPDHRPDSTSPALATAIWVPVGGRSAADAISDCPYLTGARASTTEYHRGGGPRRWTEAEDPGRD